MRLLLFRRRRFAELVSPACAATTFMLCGPAKCPVKAQASYVFSLPSPKPCQAYISVNPFLHRC